MGIFIFIIIIFILLVIVFLYDYPNIIPKLEDISKYRYLPTYFLKKSRKWNCPICNEIPTDNIAVGGGRIRISEHTISEVLNSRCKNGHIWHFARNQPSRKMLGIFKGNNDLNGFIRACIRQLYFNNYMIRPKIDVCPFCSGRVIERVYYCSNRDSRCENGHYWNNSSLKDCPQCKGRRNWYPVPIDDFPWENFNCDEEIVSKFELINSNKCPECKSDFIKGINCIGKCIICRNNHVWHNEGNGYRKNWCPSCQYDHWRINQIDEFISPDMIEKAKMGELLL